MLDRLFSWTGDTGTQDVTATVAAPVSHIGHQIHAYSTIDLANDVGFPDFMRNGTSAAGTINRKAILRNAAVARCVFVISNVIGMLPLQLLRRGENSGEVSKARDHRLYEVLALKPNGWQTAFEFRRLMQHRALVDGNAYALPIRTREGVARLVPLSNGSVQVEQKDDWTVVYRVRPKAGGRETVYQSGEMFHLRGPSEDGIKGLALVDYAGEVLGLSTRAQEAAARIFSQGVMAGGALSTDQKLGDQAIQNLRESLQHRYSGAENAGKTMILEQGLTFTPIASSAKDAQNIETRKHQIEEVARIFGVPRPFLMLDDTSWGSGIEQLGLFFVQYGLMPWFTAWEQAISLTLLTDVERQTLYPKFNERALLRGLMKDQGEFFSKLMGAGGSPQIMEQNEARDLLDLPEHPDGFGLSKGAMKTAEKPTGE